MSDIVEKFGEYLSLLNLSTRDAINEIIEEMTEQLRAEMENQQEEGTEDTLRESVRRRVLIIRIRQALHEIKRI